MFGLETENGKVGFTQRVDEVFEFRRIGEQLLVVGVEGVAAVGGCHGFALQMGSNVLFY